MAKEEYDDFIDIKQMHKDNLVNYLSSEKDVAPFIIGQNLIRRSEYLLMGGINALENKNLIILSLAARAHLETMALAGLFARKINSFKLKNINEEALRMYYKKMLVGTRLSSLGQTPAIQVMNAIDEVVANTKRVVGKEFDIRNMYDTLSETCHPNALGNMQWLNMSGENVTFTNDPIVENQGLRDATRTLLFSSYGLIIFYLDAVENLKSIGYDISDYIKEVSGPPFSGAGIGSEK